MGEPNLPAITIMNVSGETSTMLGVPVTSNASEMETARGVFRPRRFGDPPDTTYNLNQSKALSAEVAARDWVKGQYGARAQVVGEIKRPGANGVPVFDYLIQTGDNEFVLLEAKSHFSPLGYTADKVLVQDPTGATRVLSLSDEVEQLSGKWIEQRITELRRSRVPGAKELGDRLNRSWRSGRLRVLLGRGVENPLSTELLFEVVDYTDEANAYVGATPRHRIPPGSEVGSQQSSVKVRKGVSTVKSTPEQRVLLTQEAFLKGELKDVRKNVTTLTNKAKRIESRVATAKGLAVSTEGKLEELAAKEAKPKARPSPKTRSNLENELKKRRATLERLDAEAKQARKAVAEAEEEARALEGEIRMRRSEIYRLEAAKPPRPVRPPSGTPARAGDAAADASLRKTRGVESTGVPERPSTPASRSSATAMPTAESTASKADDVIHLERGATRAAEAAARLKKAAKVMKVAKTVLRLTKFVGRTAIKLFVPFTPVQVALEVFLWLESLVEKRREKEAEWIRIMTFLFDDQEVVSDRFVGRYVPTMGDLVWDAVGHRLEDEGDPQNMTSWVAKWNAERHLDPRHRFSGFVYAKMTVELIRQEHTPNWGAPYNAPTTNNPIRYYLMGGGTRPGGQERWVSFNLVSAKGMCREDKLSPPKVLEPEHKENLFTLGVYGDPLSKGQQFPSGDDVDRRVEYHSLRVTATTLRVHAIAPTPSVTPFHILVFKLRDLFVEIVRYISKFDEDFLVAEPIETSAGVFLSWYEGIARFPDGINGEVARDALRKLGVWIEELKRHVPMKGDSPQSAFERRLAIVRIGVPPRRPRQLAVMARQLNSLSNDLGDDDYKKYRLRQDPDLAYLHKESLIRLATELDEDFTRVHDDMTRTAQPGRPYQFRYVGSLATT